MQMRKAFKSFPVLIIVILQQEENTNLICGFLIVPLGQNLSMTSVKPLELAVGGVSWERTIAQWAGALLRLAGVVGCGERGGVVCAGPAQYRQQLGVQ